MRRSFLPRTPPVPFTSSTARSRPFLALSPYLALSPVSGATTPLGMSPDGCPVGPKKYHPSTADSASPRPAVISQPRLFISIPPWGERSLPVTSDQVAADDQLPPFGLNVEAGAE